jgi:hypothetical protein
VCCVMDDANWLREGVMYWVLCRHARGQEGVVVGMVRGREGDCVYMGLCGAGPKDAGETRRLLAAAQALRHTLAVQSQSEAWVACMGVNKWG